MTCQVILARKPFPAVLALRIWTHRTWVPGNAVFSAVLRVLDNKVAVEHVSRLGCHVSTAWDRTFDSLVVVLQVLV
jgi:hypothetical protein